MAGGPCRAAFALAAAEAPVGEHPVEHGQRQTAHLRRRQAVVRPAAPGCSTCRHLTESFESLSRTGERKALETHLHGKAEATITSVESQAPNNLQKREFCLKRPSDTPKLKPESWYYPESHQGSSQPPRLSRQSRLGAASRGSSSCGTPTSNPERRAMKQIPST